MSSTRASEATIRTILELGHAGHSDQRIADQVGVSRPYVWRILHGTARADVAPDVPRLPLGSPPGTKPTPQQKTGNCRTCNHWDEKLFQQRREGPESPNPCTIGVPEAGRSGSYRAGFSCSSHSALALAFRPGTSP